MERQKWAINMAKDRSHLPADALGVGIYSSHPNDNNGFTWQGNTALIAPGRCPAGGGGEMGKGGCWTVDGGLVDRETRSCVVARAPPPSSSTGGRLRSPDAGAETHGSGDGAIFMYS